jgi:tetratricopeptide (TPR) repeat protein
MEWNTRGVEAAVEAGFHDPECESNARLNLGDNLLVLGRPDEAEEQFQKVEQVVRNPGPQDRWMLWRYSQRLFHSYGELWLARGDVDKALAYADECLALAEQSDSKKNIVKACRLRGQALLAQGKLAEAEQELAAALQIAKEIGNPPQLWKTYAALGDLRKAQGRPDDARHAYRDALAVIDDVAAALTDESLRETFLTSNHVQGIRRAAELGA